MDNTYLWLKVLHILGVIIFLGNIIITGWWKVMADRTRNPQIVAFAQRQVTLTDFFLTAGGSFLLLGAGWYNATLHKMDVFNTTWLSWGYWLFFASGVLWVLILIPVQIKQARLAKAFEHGGVITQEYWMLSKIWIAVGTLATLLPIVNIYWMVFKPT